jgi:hypothetical protein
LNGSSVEPLTDAVVRKRVEVAALAYEQGRFTKDEYKQCAAPNAFPDPRCVKALQLAEVILLLQGTPEAQPITSRHTDDAPGGVVAILAPKSQLDTLARLTPMPTLRLWVHDAEHPDKPTLRFRDAGSGSVTPVQLQVSELETKETCFATNKPYGSLCFAWVPLRLETLAPLP